MEQESLENAESTIKLHYNGIKPYSHPVCINILNNLLKKVLNKLELIKVGRNSFNPNSKHQIQV